MKKYLNIEPINAETLLEIDTRVEICEELNNQEIFDLAKRKKTEKIKLKRLRTKKMYQIKMLCFQLRNYLNISNKKKTLTKKILMI